MINKENISFWANLIPGEKVLIGNVKYKIIKKVTRPLNTSETITREIVYLQSVDTGDRIVAIIQNDDTLRFLFPTPHVSPRANLERKHLKGHKEPVKPTHLLVWKDIKEDDVIEHEGEIFEVAFKAIRRGFGDFTLETAQILYLRSLSDVGNEKENVIAEVSDSGDLSFIWNLSFKNDGPLTKTLSTGKGYESWSEEDVALMREKTMLYLEMKGADLSAL